MAKTDDDSDEGSLLLEFSAKDEGGQDKERQGKESQGNTYKCEMALTMTVVGAVTKLRSLILWFP